MPVPAHLSADLAARIRAWAKDPVHFVRECFHVEPQKWQIRALRALVAGDRKRVRIALKACAGPGKTAVLAWAGWWFLLCHGGPNPETHPNGIAISCDRDNLRDGLWKELALWRGVCPLLEMLFEWTKERIFAKDHPSTWFLSARSYAKGADPETAGRTLSGLHGVNIFYLIDESGDMPVQLARAAEQGLTSCECGLILTAGNTTSTDGMLYFVSSDAREGWEVITITGDPDDPERSPRVDLEWAREQIKTFGRDNPWVMAYVLGQFPPGSINALLTVDEVEAAMGKHLTADKYEWAQKRLGCDIALYGDDSTVLFPRQGLAAFKPIQMRNAKSNEIAAQIMMVRKSWAHEVEMIDTTGGWADGVIDSLRIAGFNPYSVEFSGKPINPKYGNRRSEMYMEMRDWVRSGGALPNCPPLVGELTKPTYNFTNGKFWIEPKVLIKKRLGRSPDCFVAGTMIRTPLGFKAIEQMCVGDAVSTPMGDRKVVKVWVDTVDTLTEVSFSNGTTLEGKGSHDIFVWGAGWVRLDALSLVNGIETDSMRRRLRWWILRRLFTTVEPIGFKRLVATTPMGTKNKPSDFFTVGFGPMFTALFHRGIRFITRMGTGAITGLRIWKWLSAGCISAATYQRETSAILDYGPGWKKLGMRLGTGTGRHWVKRGTRSMGRQRGLEGPKPMLFAPCAGRYTKPTSHQDLDFVPTRVNKKRGINGPRRPLGYVLCVARHLCSTIFGRKNVVPVYVRTGLEAKGSKVYNLTLDKDNVYYANGVLVANCADALALTFALPDMPASMGLLHPSFGKSAMCQVEYDQFGEG